MPYKVYKFQNQSDYSDTDSSIVISDTDDNWDEAYSNWVSGKNPTDDKEWKLGVFACTKEIKE